MPAAVTAAITAAVLGAVGVPHHRARSDVSRAGDAVRTLDHDSDLRVVRRHTLPDPPLLGVLILHRMRIRVVFLDKWLAVVVLEGPGAVPIGQARGKAVRGGGDPAG